MGRLQTSAERTRSVAATLALPLATTALLASYAFAGPLDQSFELGGRTLVVNNLIGKIEVQGHSGNGYEVEVTIRGEDAEPDLIQIEVDEGRVSTVDILFPIHEETEYVYPELSRGSDTRFTLRNHDSDQGWLRKLLGSANSERIRVSHSGRGLEVWADVVVRVPKDGKARIYHGVGTIEAHDIHGDLVLDTRSGAIHGEHIVGDLLVDTGSGKVTLADIEGEVSCDTGSGKVEIENVEGPYVSVDTGSGKVEVRSIKCEELHIDTGSGGVRGYDLSADDANIDTGSGGVSVEFVHMGDGDFIIDTGSGGIDLIVPADASADVLAETGSGRINVNVADAKIRHKDKDEVALTIGRGDARVSLDTGSGSISIEN